MIARVALVLAAATAAVPALALTPQEAALHSARLGRPMPAMVNIAPPPNTRMFANGQRLPIYLNRHGGNYVCGNDDSSRNVSSVVCGNNGSGSGSVGSFSGNDQDWNYVMSCVTDQFSRFNLTVTDIEPASGEYVEAVVGGTPDQAGMPFGVGGVAPFTCGLIPTGVVYAFADVYGGDNQGICETVAQEVSHAFGLDHEFLCQDPMTYLSGCGDKTFQDADASCGEFQPRQCQCGGASQNSVQEMFQVIGASDGTTPPPPPPDQGPPTVSLTSPANQAILTANSTITVTATAHDDSSLPVVELQWDFTGESMFCPATADQTGSYSCSQSGDTFTWSIQVGQGSRTFRVHVRDGAGNDAITEDRTIWLSTDGSGPPQDGGPPQVFIATPAADAQLAANSSVNIIAQAGDDSGLARVELAWTGGPGGDLNIPCPADGSQGVTCVVNGSTYTWTLQVGSGTRTFTVSATDVVGNLTRTEPRTISLVDSPQNPQDDQNTGDNTVDTATRIHCGDTVQGVATDADWFAFIAPDGETATISVDGDAKGNVDVVATKGAGSVLADGNNGDVTVAGDGSMVNVGVLPNDVHAGSYTIKVTCDAVAPPAKKGIAAGTCGNAGLPASWVALLGGLALLRIRRRRA